MLILQAAPKITEAAECINKKDSQKCVYAIINSMFTYQTKVKLHDTDAAGVIFFANQFKIIHDAYESLLEQIGFGFAELIRGKDFFLPIVHAESDYKAPLFVGDVLEVQVKVGRVGQTSFTLTYALLNARQEIVGTGRTVHVTVSKATHQKILLPADLRAKLEKLHQQDQSKR